MQSEASKASVLRVTGLEDWSSCQNTSGFGLSQRLMNFPAMEFWGRSRWGGIRWCKNGTRCTTARVQSSSVPLPSGCAA
jgi:hypothetical protein